MSLSAASSAREERILVARTVHAEIEPRSAFGDIGSPLTNTVREECGDFRLNC